MKEEYHSRHYRLWEKLVYFFPIQLLFVHLKKNLLLLSFWIILFAIVTSNLSLKYGVPYLFLDPEYLGEVGILSHLIVGVSTGAFIMSFNITSYMLNGFRFSFLATLNRPFLKYCQNNILIPLSFCLVYVVAMIHFQLNNEQRSSGEVALNILGFWVGNFLFILITLGYFVLTNKNLFHFIKPKVKETDELAPVKDLLSNQRSHEVRHKKEWKVVTYISRLGKIAITRDSSHYKRDTLSKVFAQNRINASFFQLGTITAVLVLGFFGDLDLLQIPAASSIFLFFTMLIMVVSAMYTWFRSWTSLVMIVLMVFFNQLSTMGDFIYKNQAYGLDYSKSPVLYSQNQIVNHQTDLSQISEDSLRVISILENWKQKVGNDSVAIFINAPGGGLRSTLWTATALLKADSLTQGKLWRNCVLVSGSSGGMLGAALLREYKLRIEDNSQVPIQSILLSDLGQDKLNTVAATALMNDAFFRFKRFEYKDAKYIYDRATAFERRFNSDTYGWLDKSLSDYAVLEFEAKIPLLLIAPTISEDGRRLLISSTPMGHLCAQGMNNSLEDNIEFSHFFKGHNPGNLSFLTALRMSATFPYVFPSTNLPTAPAIEILDAGIRDNTGMSNTMSFIKAHKDWLEKHTKRILIVQIRDQEKAREIDGTGRPSILEGVSQPMGTFYKTVLRVQDYMIDDKLNLMNEWYTEDIEMVELVLNRSESNPISLSWHLTASEKARINRAIETETNQRAYEKLHRAINY